MRNDYIDFHYVAPQHLAVHERLVQWAAWVKVRPHGWQVSPMFRQVKSNSFQWHAPAPKLVVNIPEALEVEKIVSDLPEKHREAIRWCYVRPTDPRSTAKRLGVSLDGLRELLANGRSMLHNRIRPTNGTCTAHA